MSEPRHEVTEQFCCTCHTAKPVSPMCDDCHAFAVNVARDIGARDADIDTLRADLERARADAEDAERRVGVWHKRHDKVADERDAAKQEIERLWAALERRGCRREIPE